jgi:RHS repeat-associated protein
VRAQRDCKGINERCRLDKIRRVVWDADQELYEIQMPGGEGSTYLENDTSQVKLAAIQDLDTDNYFDPNVYYGRVAFTPGLSIDQPLSVVRFGYRSVMDQDGNVRSALDWSPFAIAPLWSSKGQADLGTFEDGKLDKCISFEGVTRCVWRDWLAQVHAYNRSRARRNVWHGSQLEDKQDAAGTLYRRNRVYDPVTGRFTQEDPIGLAGGLNLYGYAGGDPVNFSDPFGLCRWSQIEARRNSGEECTKEELARVNGGVEEAMFSPLDLIGGIGSGARMAVAGSSRLLGRALVASGLLRPARSAAHHIVADGAARAAPARQILQRFNVDVNSAGNGLFLPAGQHARIHTNAYYDAVNEALSQATNRQQVMEILKDIGRQVQQGTFPR